jgi:L-fucose isomerase-like protein
MKNSDKVVAFGICSYAHDFSTMEKRVKDTIPFISEKINNLQYLGTYDDIDFQKLSGLKESVDKDLANISCIIIILSGWAQSPPILRVISNCKNIPVYVLGLAGYYTGQGLIAPSAAAGASLLKYSLNNLEYKFHIDVQRIGEEINLDKLLDFTCAAGAFKSLKDIKIASIGYACSNLPPFMYDGNLIKKVTGVEVENIDLIEISEKIKTLKKSELNDYKENFINEFEFSGKIPESEINTQAQFCIAVEKIVHENNYKAITMKCGSGTGKYFKFTPCMVLSSIGSKIDAICESDVYNLVLQVALSEMSAGKSMFLEFFEFYKESILMASCGFAPYSICKIPKKVMAHDWGGDGGIMNISDLHEGLVTVSTLFPNEGRLNIHMAKGTGKTPEMFQEEGWAKRKGPKIPSLEIKLCGDNDYFIENIKGPHYMVTYGDVTQKLRFFSHISGINIS